MKPVFDERTSKFLFEYYILKVFINYIDLAESDEMLVREVVTKNTVEDLVTVEFLEDLSTGIEFEESRRVQDIRLIKGNKKELKTKVSSLLVTFIQAIEDNRHKTNYSY